MGLFGKKESCAICGGKVKALFPWKIEGHLICNSCHGNVDLPEGVENNMTMDEFRAYLSFREENGALRHQFKTTQQVDFGWLDDKFLFDMNNGLLCMDKNLNKTIFEAKHIQSFVIREDSAPIYEGSAAGLVCYPSYVPDRVMAMEPQLHQIRMQEQMQRNMERMVDMRDGKRDYDVHFGSNYHDIPEPFQKFVIEIHFQQHPYWSFYTADMGGPTFSNTSPDANAYLRDYNNKVGIMDQLARALMELAFPGAGMQQAGAIDPVMSTQAVVTPTMSVDAVSEIQRFKALVDQGILTEEEFAAKKRQLLGI